MSRGVTIREDATYNQDLNSKIILVKIGGIDNTLEELNNTIEVFWTSRSKKYAWKYGWC